MYQYFKCVASDAFLDITSLDIGLNRTQVLRPVVSNTEKLEITKS